MLARTRSLTLAVLSGSKIKVAPVSIAPVDETADTPGTEVAQAPEASDVELVARAVGGEEGAFEELFNRHRRRVALIASRFFPQREQIEEVVQEGLDRKSTR